MKVIQKEEIIPPQPEKKVAKTVYVASDGKEFQFESQCERYEKKLEVESHPVFRSRIPSIETFYDYDSATLYYIRSQEDYEFWCGNIGTRHLSVDHWEDGFGPGWYLFFSEDGGDHADFYYLYKLDEYEQDIKRRLERWHDDVESKIAAHTE